MQNLPSLTRKEAEDIRQQYAQGMAISKLAYKYEVNAQTVKAIIRGTWRLSWFPDRTDPLQPYWPITDTGASIPWRLGMPRTVEISRQQAQAICDKHRAGQSLKELGYEYRINPQTVRQIVGGIWHMRTYWDRTDRLQPYWPPSEEYQRINGRG